MRHALLLLLLIALLVPGGAFARGGGVVATGLSKAEVEAAYTPRKMALLVGVDGYDDPFFSPLAFAAEDAQALARSLRDARLGGFSRVDVLRARQETTASRIVQELKDLLDSAEPQDTVLVYISAHGTLEVDWSGAPDLFVVASDSRKEDLPGSALRVREIQDALGRSRARRKILILDACHHGAGKSAVPPETLAMLRGLKGAATPVLREPERGYEAHLFASTFGLPALEDPALGHGVYTHYLIEALSNEARQADRDGDGLISVSEAHDFARDSTISHTDQVQVPRALYHIVGREEIFLSGDEALRSDAEAALLFSYDDFYAECSVDIDGTYRGMLPRGLALEPGARRVRVTTPGGEVLVDREVRAVAGRVIDVSKLHAETRPSRARVGVGVGVWGAFAAPMDSPFGGPLGGVAFHLGTSFPGDRPARAHLRLDLDLAGGRYEVPIEEHSFAAHVVALDVSGVFGLHLRVRRFGLVLGPRIGLLTIFRPPVVDGPADPHLLTWQAGVLAEPSLSVWRNVQVSLALVLGVTSADLLRRGAPAPLLFGRVQGGVTFAL